MHPITLFLAAVPVVYAVVTIAVEGGVLVDRLLEPVRAAQAERHRAAVAKLRADLAPRPAAAKPEPAPAKPEPTPVVVTPAPAPMPVAPRRFPRGSRPGRAAEFDDAPTGIYERRDIFDAPTRRISFDAPTRVVRPAK